jgi:hypothetical protein
MQGGRLRQQICAEGKDATLLLSPMQMAGCTGSHASENQGNPEGEIMIKIDSDIPVPMPKRGSFLKTCRLMEVGQSAFFAGADIKGTSCVFRLRPRRFASRTVIEDGVKGVRVWRVE